MAGFTTAGARDESISATRSHCSGGTTGSRGFGIKRLVAYLRDYEAAVMMICRRRAWPRPILLRTISIPFARS